MSHLYTKAEIEFLEANASAMSHTEIAKKLNRSMPSIRNKCWRLGLVDTSNNWTDEQIKILILAYTGIACSDDINLSKLAADLGKLKSNVCRKARELGLTDIGRIGKLPKNRKIRVNKFSGKEEVAANMSAIQKALIAANGHPKRMAGKHHSDETKKRLSETTTTINANRTQEQKMAFLLKAMKTKVANGTSVQERPNASWKAGWREIGGVRKYYRSRWEANYAHYLEWLKQLGEIEEWLHEPVTFWFGGVKRGCVSYLPDFWVKEKNGSESYHEVKGWMDDRSKTKIRRMAKYHPKVKLVVIDSKGYGSILKTAKGLVPGWEA